MTPDQAASIVEAARAKLDSYGQMRADMPAEIRVAWKLGITKQEIHERTGLARSTIDRWLGHYPKPAMGTPDGRPGQRTPPAAGPVPGHE